MLSFAPLGIDDSLSLNSDRLAALHSVYCAVEQHLFNTMSIIPAGMTTSEKVESFIFHIDGVSISLPVLAITEDNRFVTLAATSAINCCEYQAKTDQLHALHNKVLGVYIQSSCEEWLDREQLLDNEHFGSTLATLRGCHIVDPNTNDSAYNLSYDLNNYMATVTPLSDYDKPKAVKFCKWLQNYLQLDAEDKLSTVVRIVPTKTGAGYGGGTTWKMDDFCICSANARILIMGWDEYTDDGNQLSGERLSINTVLFQIGNRQYKALPVSSLQLMGTTATASWIRSYDQV